MGIEQSGRDKLVDVVEVPTRAKLNFTETLRSLAIGQTIRFPVGSNSASIRTMATINGIRLHMRSLDTGEIEVTRYEARPKRQKAPVKTEDKLYDL